MNNISKIIGLLCTFSVSSVFGLGGTATADTDNTHNNVGFISLNYEGLREFLLCSSTLLHKDDKKFVILTSGHCSMAHKRFANLGFPSNYTDYKVTFDSNIFLDSGNKIGGGVAINAPQFFDYTGSTTGFSQNTDNLDLGLIVFPATSKNAYNKTISEAWPGITPVQVVEEWGINEILDSFQTPTNDFLAKQVGYGFPNPGQKYVGNVGFQNIVRNYILYSQQKNQDEAESNAGDSGSPIFYPPDDLVNQVQISVHKYGLGVWGEGSGNGPNYGPMGGAARLDVPAAQALINCAKDASIQQDDYNTQISKIQSCVDTIEVGR